MDMLISAVASDLVGRFISFLSQRYGKQPAATTAEAEDLERLRRVLLRIHTVVEEAEARQIMSRAMDLQLRGLMEGMYLGYHVLDTFKFQSPQEEDHQVSHKRLHLCSSTSTSRTTSSSLASSGMLKSVVESLETKITDVREFVILLASSPRLPQQPPSTYLFMDRCMFGRHVEKEQVIRFLLQDDQNLAILPLIGPHWIGKRTLVHHACQDEPVRSRFPHPIFYHGDDDDFRSRPLAPSREKCLCVVEFSWDVDVQAWETFRSSLDKAAASGSKVVIMGRTDGIAKLGTTAPIRLKSLSEEEYWYYFKALAFGTMDLDEHPKLASLGMQLATQLQGSFLGASIVGQILRDNPDAVIWRSLLMSLRGMSQMGFFLFGERCPGDILAKNNPVDVAKLECLRFRGCLVYDLRELAAGQHVQSDLPRLTTEGPLVDGKVSCDERFDVLVWRSRIPPFCDYVATYVKPVPRRVVRRKNHQLSLGNCKNDLV